MIRTILTSSRKALLREISRLNRRAAKVGVSQIEARHLGPKSVTRTVVTSYDGETSESSYPVQVDEFELILPETQDYAWELQATLTPVDGEAKLFVDAHVPNFDVAAWESADPCRCDHCNTRRNRHKLFVVRHREGGTVQQVGTQCFEDYVGHEGVAKLEFLSVLYSVLRDDEDFVFGGSGHGPDLMDVRHLIALAELIAERDGWSNNVKNDYGELVSPGTHRIAADYLRGKHSIPSELAKRMTDDSDAVWARVDRIIDRIAELELPADDEFAQSIRYCLQHVLVPSNKAGLVAYAGEFLRNHDRRVLRDAKRATMVHVGTVGKRETFSNLTVNRINGFETAYGFMEIVSFLDEQGNQLVWKTSANPFETDQKVTVKATVKEHSTYRDAAQTVITRVKEVA